MPQWTSPTSRRASPGRCRIQAARVLRRRPAPGTPTRISSGRPTSFRISRAAAIRRPMRRSNASSRSLIISASPMGSSCKATRMSTTTRVVLDALTRFPARLRGIAITDTRIKPETLRDWHARGMRGLRFHLFPQRPNYIRGVGLDVFAVFRKYNGGARLGGAILLRSSHARADRRRRCARLRAT